MTEENQTPEQPSEAPAPAPEQPQPVSPETSAFDARMAELKADKGGEKTKEEGEATDKELATGEEPGVDEETGEDAALTEAGEGGEERGEEEAVDPLPDHAPKKGRALREYQRAQKAEKELAEYRTLADKQQRESIERDIKMRNLEESIALMGAGKKPEEKKADIDKLLEENGIDPESVVDKEALGVILGKISNTEKTATEGKQSSDDTRYYQAVDSTLGNLDEGTRAVAQEAISYLIESEARGIMAQAGFEGHTITPEKALEIASCQVDDIGKKMHSKGINPVQWAWKMSRSRGYTPKEAPAGQTNGVSIKGLAKARDTAGRPEVDTAPVKLAAESFDAAVNARRKHNEKKLKSA